MEGHTMTTTSFVRTVVATDIAADTQHVLTVPAGEHFVWVHDAESRYWLSVTDAHMLDVFELISRDDEDHCVSDLEDNRDECDCGMSDRYCYGTVEYRSISTGERYSKVTRDDSRIHLVTVGPLPVVDTEPAEDTEPADGLTEDIDTIARTITAPELAEGDWFQFTAESLRSLSISGYAGHTLVATRDADKRRSECAITFMWK